MLYIVPAIALLVCVKSEAENMDQINYMFIYIWDIIKVKAEVAFCFPATLSGSLIQFSVEVIEKSWLHLELFVAGECVRDFCLLFCNYLLLSWYADSFWLVLQTTMQIYIIYIISLPD